MVITVCSLFCKYFHIYITFYTNKPIYSPLNNRLCRMTSGGGDRRQDNEAILAADPSNTWDIHSGDVIMGTVTSQINSLTIVYSTVYSGADQRKHQSCASLAFVRGIHRGPVNSPHKWPVTRKTFPFDDVIMIY